MRFVPALSALFSAAAGLDVSAISADGDATFTDALRSVTVQEMLSRNECTDRGCGREIAVNLKAISRAGITKDAQLLLSVVQHDAVSPNFAFR